MLLVSLAFAADPVTCARGWLLDPAGRCVQWVPLSDTTRDGAHSVDLGDGRVLLTGGHSPPTDGEPGRAHDDATLLAIDDPLARTWLPLRERRAYHTAERLPDGRVLLIGGVRDLTGAGPTRAEVPALTWEVVDPDRPGATDLPSGALREPSVLAHATLLPNGSVLYGGGVDAIEDGAQLQTRIWRLDPRTGVIRRRAPLPLPLEVALFFPHPAGAEVLGEAEGRILDLVYDAARDRWSAHDLGAAPERVRGVAAAVLPDGATVFGGFPVGYPERTRALWLRPAGARLWEPLALPNALSGFSFCDLVGSGAPDAPSLVVVCEDAIHVWSAVAGTWETTERFGTGDGSVSGLGEHDGRILVAHSELGFGLIDLARRQTGFLLPALRDMVDFDVVEAPDGPIWTAWDPPHHVSTVFVPRDGWWWPVMVPARHANVHAWALLRDPDARLTLHSGGPKSYTAAPPYTEWADAPPAPFARPKGGAPPRKVHLTDGAWLVVADALHRSDPVDGSWSVLPRPPAAPFVLSALPGGGVLSRGPGAPLRYDLGGAWSAMHPPWGAQTTQFTPLLFADRLLATGILGTGRRQAWWYSPGSDEWEEARGFEVSYPIEATVVSDLVHAVSDGSRAWILDPARGWTSTLRPPVPTGTTRDGYRLLDTPLFATPDGAVLWGTDGSARWRVRGAADPERLAVTDLPVRELAGRVECLLGRGTDCDRPLPPPGPTAFPTVFEEGTAPRRQRRRGGPSTFAALVLDDAWSGDVSARLELVGPGPVPTLRWGEGLFSPDTTEAGPSVPLVWPGSGTAPEGADRDPWQRRRRIAHEVDRVLSLVSDAARSLRGPHDPGALREVHVDRAVAEGFSTEGTLTVVFRGWRRTPDGPVAWFTLEGALEGTGVAAPNEHGSPGSPGPIPMAEASVISGEAYWDPARDEPAYVQIVVHRATGGTAPAEYSRASDRAVGSVATTRLFVTREPADARADAG